MTGSHVDPPIRAAVVDTDSGHIRVLCKRMESLGWHYRVSSGPLSVSALVSMRVNVLVVDLAVLGQDAWTYLETVCERLPGLAVVVCTGRATVPQRVRGLRTGADDWVNKPCHPDELVARVEAIVRRRRRGEVRTPARALEAGGIEIRADQYQAFAGDVSAELTRREFELIQLLAAAEGQVLPREEIYQRVWGYAMAHGDRSVDVFVRKVRQKLERASPDWRYIHTHFGVGYRFAAERIDGRPAAPEPANDSAGAAVDAAARGADAPARGAAARGADAPAPA